MSPRQFRPTCLEQRRIMQAPRLHLLLVYWGAGKVETDWLSCGLSKLVAMASLPRLLPVSSCRYQSRLSISAESQRCLLTVLGEVQLLLVKLLAVCCRFLIAGINDSKLVPGANPSESTMADSESQETCAGMTTPLLGSVDCWIAASAHSDDVAATM